jgi:hypothetical protein
MPAIEIKKRVITSVWDNYFKFCVIRNPFEKVISGFYFFENEITPANAINNFRNWVKNDISIIFDRNRYFINGEICIDYFIRYEDLENGVKHVCNLLDIPFEPEKIPKLKAGLRTKELPL